MSYISEESPIRLADLFALVHSRLIQKQNRVLEKVELTTPQWQVLEAIVYRNCGTPSSISELLDVDGAAITRHLDTLERKGLVMRSRSSSDRRSVKLEPTGKAERIAPQAVARASEVELWLLESLGEAESDWLREQLSDLLAERKPVKRALDDWERS